MITLLRFRRMVIGEELSDQCDGSNQLFTTTYNFNPEKIEVYVNGQRLAKGVDFTVTDDNEFRITNYEPESTFIILVDYERA